MKNKIIITLILLGTISYSQSLEEYIAIAKTNNSALKVASYKHNVAIEKINEEGNLENTSFSLGLFALQPETRVGAQNTKVGISQNIPWFGTLKTQKEVAKATSELQKYNVQLSSRDITFNVKQAYYTIYEQLAIHYILKENKLILSTYENMALAALENNKATMSDVLRIRVQKNELHSKIFQNLNTITRLSNNFNRILKQNENVMLKIVDSLNVLDILNANQVIENHPLLKQLSEQEKVYQAQKKLIAKKSKPKLSVGVDYIWVNERNNITLSDNGKDILMPKVGLSIPLFTKKYRSQTKQIKLKQEQLVEQQEQQKINLENALEISILEYENAVLTVVAAQKNKTELQQAINVDLKAYETGILDYDKILRLQLQKIKFELKEIQATKKAFIAKSKIEYLVKNN